MRVAKPAQNKIQHLRERSAAFSAYMGDKKWRWRVLGLAVVLAFGACSKQAAKEAFFLQDLVVEESTRAVPPAGGSITLLWDQFPPDITVTLGSTPCTITSQTETQVTCSVGAISNPRWEYATVSLQSTGNVLLRSTKKVALGAVVVGQSSPTTGTFSTNNGLERPDALIPLGQKIGAILGGYLLTWDEDTTTNRILPDYLSLIHI